MTVLVDLRNPMQSNILMSKIPLLYFIFIIKVTVGSTCSQKLAYFLYINALGKILGKLLNLI